MDFCPQRRSIYYVVHILVPATLLDMYASL